MENNSKKNKHRSEETSKNEDSSLEDEIIEQLKQRNDDIASGKVTEKERSSKDDGNLGSFDEWSVSWP